MEVLPLYLRLLGRVSSWSIKVAGYDGDWCAGL